MTIGRRCFSEYLGTYNYKCSTAHISEVVDETNISKLFQESANSEKVIKVVNLIMGHNCMHT